MAQTAQWDADERAQRTPCGVWGEISSPRSTWLAKAVEREPALGIRVSIEFKNGNCIDIQYDQIARMQHHNTTLVPGWVGFVGLCLFYASWRVISPPNIRFAVFVLGLAMISGWVLTNVRR